MRCPPLRRYIYISVRPCAGISIRRCRAHAYAGISIRYCCAHVRRTARAARAFRSRAVFSWHQAFGPAVSLAVVARQYRVLFRAHAGYATDPHDACSLDSTASKLRSFDASSSLQRRRRQQPRGGGGDDPRAPRARTERRGAVVEQSPAWTAVPDRWLRAGREMSAASGAATLAMHFQAGRGRRIATAAGTVRVCFTAPAPPVWLEGARKNKIRRAIYTWRKNSVQITNGVVRDGDRCISVEGKFERSRERRVCSRQHGGGHRRNVVGRRRRDMSLHRVCAAGDGPLAACGDQTVMRD